MAILLDTGFLYAFYNKEDINHEIVKSSYDTLLDGQFGIPFLLDYVFDELVTLIQLRTKRNDIATEIGKIILGDCQKYIQFARVSKTNFDQAWELFRYQSRNKYLSFTDCVLIKFAEVRKIKFVATLDSGFRSWVETIPKI